jgi:hypothetical protein
MSTLRLPFIGGPYDGLHVEMPADRCPVVVNLGLLDSDGLRLRKRLVRYQLLIGATPENLECRPHSYHYIGTRRNRGTDR